MILSVATSVVFLFLTRKGHLLPRLRKAVLWTDCRKNHPHFARALKNKNFFRSLSIES